jgi:hypothetical protein
MEGGGCTDGVFAPQRDTFVGGGVRLETVEKAHRDSFLYSRATVPVENCTTVKHFAERVLR